jgi:hypothetical protein
MAKHTKRNMLRKNKTRRNKLRKNLTRTNKSRNGKTRRGNKRYIKSGGLFKLTYELPDKEKNDFTQFNKSIENAYEISQKIDKSTINQQNMKTKLQSEMEKLKNLLSNNVEDVYKKEILISNRKNDKRMKQYENIITTNLIKLPDDKEENDRLNKMIPNYENVEYNEKKKKYEYRDEDKNTTAMLNSELQTHQSMLGNSKRATKYNLTDTKKKIVNDYILTIRNKIAKNKSKIPEATYTTPNKVIETDLSDYIQKLNSDNNFVDSEFETEINNQITALETKMRELDSNPNIKSETKHTVSFKCYKDGFINKPQTIFANLTDVYNSIKSGIILQVTFKDVGSKYPITISRKMVGSSEYKISFYGSTWDFTQCVISIQLDVTYIRDINPSSLTDLKYDIPNYSSYGIPNEYKALYNYTPNPLSDNKFGCIETYLREIKGHYTEIEKYYSENKTNQSLIPINVYNGFDISKETLKWLNEFLQSDIKQCIKYNIRTITKKIEGKEKEVERKELIGFNIIINKKIAFVKGKGYDGEESNMREHKLLCNPLSCILPRSNMNNNSDEYKTLSTRISTLTLYTTVYRDYVELIMNHYLLVMNNTIIDLKKLCVHENPPTSLQINETITHTLEYVGQLSVGKLTLSEVESIHSIIQKKTNTDTTYNGLLIFMTAFKGVKNFFNKKQDFFNDEQYVFRDFLYRYAKYYNPPFDYNTIEYDKMKYKEIKELFFKEFTIENIEQENIDIINKSMEKIENIRKITYQIQTENTNIDSKPTINITTDYFIQFFETKKAELDKTQIQQPLPESK